MTASELVEYARTVKAKVIFLFFCTWLK